MSALLGADYCPNRLSLSDVSVPNEKIKTSCDDSSFIPSGLFHSHVTFSCGLAILPCFRGCWWVVAEYNSRPNQRLAPATTCLGQRDEGATSVQNRGWILARLVLSVCNVLYVRNFIQRG